MANDTQSYTENFSNENSNNSSDWSDSQETPKITVKTINHQNFCAIHVTQIVKK